MNQDRELELLRKIEALVVDRERLRGALAFIDCIAIRHERGAAVKMQKVARAALGLDEQKGSTDG
jgi:hypothetical protein